mmetsp:Transcript_63127/g.179473  ORF Transcript_63127/g.179473 Transcript_63127/m.179473 type:complete len:439 (-) Transcript_63127:25-1341(-)
MRPLAAEADASLPPLPHLVLVAEGLVLAGALLPQLAAEVVVAVLPLELIAVRGAPAAVNLAGAAEALPVRAGLVLHVPRVTGLLALARVRVGGRVRLDELVGVLEDHGPVSVLVLGRGAAEVPHLPLTRRQEAKSAEGHHLLARGCDKGLVEGQAAARHGVVVKVFFARVQVLVPQVERDPQVARPAIGVPHVRVFAGAAADYWLIHPREPPVDDFDLSWVVQFEHGIASVEVAMGHLEVLQVLVGQEQRGCADFAREGVLAELLFVVAIQSLVALEELHREKLSLVRGVRLHLQIKVVLWHVRVALFREVVRDFNLGLHHSQGVAPGAVRALEHGPEGSARFWAGAAAQQDHGCLPAQTPAELSFHHAVPVIGGELALAHAGLELPPGPGPALAVEQARALEAVASRHGREEREKRQRSAGGHGERPGPERIDREYW